MTASARVLALHPDAVCISRTVCGHKQYRIRAANPNTDRSIYLCDWKRAEQDAWDAAYGAMTSGRKQPRHA